MNETEKPKCSCNCDCNGPEDPNDTAIMNREACCVGPMDPSEPAKRSPLVWIIPVVVVAGVLAYLFLAR